MKKVIVMENNASLREIVHFILVSQLGHPVIEYGDFEETKKHIENYSEDVLYVLTSKKFEEGQGIELYRVLRGKDKFIPFFFLDEENPKSIKGVEEDDYVFGVKEIDIPDKLVGLISTLFELDKSSANTEYMEIPVKTFSRISNLSEDVFIQLKGGRFLKIFSQGDPITKDDVGKYLSKGLQFFHVNKLVGTWVLRTIQGSFQQIISGEEIDIALDPKLKEQIKREIQIETGSKDVIDYTKNASDGEGQSLDYSQNKMGHSEEGAEENSEEEPTIFDVEPEPVVKFNFEKEFMDRMNEKISETKGSIKNNPVLYKHLKKFKVSRKKEDFFASRLQLVTTISCGLARIMEWGTDQTLQKLIYSAYMHDIGLADNRELAKIQTLIEFDSMAGKFEEGDREKLIKHPEHATFLVADDPRAPDEVETILLQHHELPNGQGFPLKLSGSKITGLAALFQISIDLAQYILLTPKWNLQNFTYARKDRYKGGSFSKIFNSLKKLERYMK